MLRLSLTLLLLSPAVPARASSQAQLPAGTRQADDHTRENAASARIQAAESALEKNDFETAVKLLTVLATERPKDARVLYDLGYAAERVGDDDSAAKAYTAAIAADATAAEPLAALGLLDARAGHTDKAHTELKAAAALPSAAPEVRGRVLRALAALDQTADPAAAREEILEAVKLTGETPADVAMGAGMAAHAGNTTDAEAGYRRALATDPHDAEAAAALAPLLKRDGKAAEAEQILQAALQAHANDPRLVSQLVSIYASEGKSAEGIALLEQARAADPAFAANPAGTRMLARLESLGDKNDDAAHLYESLSAKDSGDPALLDEYGSVLVKLARFAEAETILGKAVGMRTAFATPEDWAEAEGHFAFAASRNHDPKVTLQALAARATVLPNSAASLFLEATAHDSLRETKDAVKAYRAFLTMANGKFPDQEFQARHRLVALEHMR